MDLINIANEIQRIIKEMNTIRKEIRKRAEAASLSLSEYRRDLATTIIKLKNGVELEHEGQKVINPTATITLEISRGICYKQKLKADTADKLYKSALIHLDNLKTQLTAEQSLLKYMEVR